MTRSTTSRKRRRQSSQGGDIVGMAIGFYVGPIGSILSFVYPPVGSMSWILSHPILRSKSDAYHMYAQE
jgi:hypothetical protein